jgi:hypothetical protein
VSASPAADSAVHDVLDDLPGDHPRLADLISANHLEPELTERWFDQGPHEEVSVLSCLRVLIPDGGDIEARRVEVVRGLAAGGRGGPPRSRGLWRRGWQCNGRWGRRLICWRVILDKRIYGNEALRPADRPQHSDVLGVDCEGLDTGGQVPLGDAEFPRLVHQYSLGGKARIKVCLVQLLEDINGLDCEVKASACPIGGRRGVTDYSEPGLREPPTSQRCSCRL